MTGGIEYGKIYFTEEEINYFLERARYDLVLQREIWNLLFELCAQELEEKLPGKRVFNLCQKILNVDQKEIAYFTGRIYDGFSYQEIPEISEGMAKQGMPVQKINGGIRTNNGKFFSAEEIETLLNSLKRNPHIWRFMINFLNREIYGMNARQNGTVLDEKLLDIGVKIVMAINGFSEKIAADLIKDNGSSGWSQKNYAEKEKQMVT